MAKRRKTQHERCQDLEEYDWNSYHKYLESFAEAGLLHTAWKRGKKKITPAEDCPQFYKTSGYLKVEDLLERLERTLAADWYGSEPRRSR